MQFIVILLLFLLLTVGVLTNYWPSRRVIAKLAGSKFEYDVDGETTKKKNSKSCSVIRRLGNRPETDSANYELVPRVCARRFTDIFIFFFSSTRGFSPWLLVLNDVRIFFFSPKRFSFPDVSPPGLRSERNLLFRTAEDALYVYTYIVRETTRMPYPTEHLQVITFPVRQRVATSGRT